jgi:hypothetical protein
MDDKPTVIVPKEIVGSKDLRESFKDNPRVRGSFFINHIEMHQFEANSPASVVSQINAKTAMHYVTAEIDDGGHLVLIDYSGADIRIRLGAPYVDVEPATTGDAARDMMNLMKYQAEQEREKDRGNHILELLGLEATAADPEVAGSVQPGFETGRSAEDRRASYPQDPNLSDDDRRRAWNDEHVRELRATEGLAADPNHQPIDGEYVPQPPIPPQPVVQHTET